MALAQPDPHIYSLYISNTVAKIYIFNHSPHSEIMRVSNVSITPQGKVPSLATLTMQTIRTHSKLQKHGSLFTQFSKLLPLSLANAVSIEYRPLEFNSLTSYDPERNWRCACNKIQSCCQYIRENPRCCLGRPSHLLCKNTDISICIRELRF